MSARKPPSIIAARAVYSTPWFDLVAKTVEGEPKPYFSLRLDDYSTVLALTPQNEVLLVRQFRPAVDRLTLELPSGMPNTGELIEDAARRELWEETGYWAQELELLGPPLFSDTGRLGNRFHCFFARRAALDPSRAEWKPERGIEVMTQTPAKLLQAIDTGEFANTLHIAAILLAHRKKVFP